LRRRKTRFEIDNYVTAERKLKADLLIEPVESGLAQAVAEVAEPELKEEREDAARKIGAGEIRIIHRRIPVVDKLGATVVHFAAKDNIGVFGQAWHDGTKNSSLARTVSAVVRSGEIRREDIKA
jgi:hypothetical protein